MLNISVSRSDGSGIVNEDVVGHCDAAAWVIDGATGLGTNLIDGPSDAAWYAACADRELRAAFARDAVRPTPDVIRDVIAACRDAFAAECRRPAGAAHELPSAAFAMVRQIGDQVELAILGDCRIAYHDADGTARMFGTTALAAFEGQTLALARQIRSEFPDIHATDLRALLLPQLRENRQRMNQSDGYWVLGTDPAAADHLDMMTLRATIGDRFAIASDGFLRLIELFDTATPGDFLGIDSSECFDTWLARLRLHERAPRSQQHFPRVKESDDASLLCCVIG